VAVVGAIEAGDCGALEGTENFDQRPMRTQAVKLSAPHDAAEGALRPRGNGNRLPLKSEEIPLGIPESTKVNHGLIQFERTMCESDSEPPQGDPSLDQREPQSCTVRGKASI